MDQPKSDSPPLDVNDHPDCSPVGSPDVAGSHLPLPPPDDLAPPTLSVDLRDKIIKQVEYYFSDENLVNDKFLMKHVMKNKDGYVPIGIIASFRKMKNLTKETSLIVSALRESSALMVSSKGKTVKRRHPLPPSVYKDPMTCTVLVENLPEDHSEENLRKVFGEAGNVVNVIVREAHDLKETKNVTTSEKLLLGKLHALVEYDSVEAAEKAVALLNNEQDWRYGLRVKFLKKLGKTEQRKAYKESNGEKSSGIQVSNHGADDETAESKEHHQDTRCNEDGEEHLGEDKGGEQLHKEKTLKREKNGDHHHHHGHKEKNEHKTRYHGHGQGQGQGQGQSHGHGQGHGHGHGHGQGQGQGQGHGQGQGQGQGHGHGRRQKHGSANAHGHGTSPAHVVEVTKPPPGPRMPDGSRGFAVGRGRALVPSTMS